LCLAGAPPRAPVPDREARQEMARARLATKLLPRRHEAAGGFGRVLVVIPGVGPVVRRIVEVVWHGSRSVPQSLGGPGPSKTLYSSRTPSQHFWPRSSVAEME